MFINLFNYEKEQNKNIVCTWSITCNYKMNRKQGRNSEQPFRECITRPTLYKMNDLQ